jgi:hypothetical protein
MGLKDTHWSFVCLSQDWRPDMEKTSWFPTHESSSLRNVLHNFHIPLQKWQGTTEIWQAGGRHYDGSIADS